MESRAKLFGHPIHPILIVFPLGLLVVAVIFDVIGLTTNNHFWAALAYDLIGVGVLGGLTAAVFGLVDYVTIPQNTRAKTIGLMHGTINLVVVLLFSGSWFLRHEAPPYPSNLALTLGFIGVGLALIASWLGGELVARLGMGVDDGAQLNAPNSLSGRPAVEHSSSVPTKQPRQAH